MATNVTVSSTTRVLVPLTQAPAGAHGEPGPSGENAGAALVAAIDLAPGTPVTISLATGQLLPARADAKPLSFVVGLITGHVPTGFTSTPSRGAVTLADWSAIAGTAALLVGQPYFLAQSGGLTLTPPTAPGLMVARIGLASTPTTLVVRPSDPIQL